MQLRSILSFWLTLSLSSTGCSSRTLLKEADDAFLRKDFDRASELLRAGLEKEGWRGRDSLVYMMDLAIALHQKRDYRESIRVLLEAEKIAEIKDYSSLATEATTLLTTDQIQDYKGENYEKVLIHVYLLLNFALLGEQEGALVEARKVNRMLSRMRDEGKKPYELSPIAEYLAAVLYEASHDYNNAYISYKKFLEMRPDDPEIYRDLFRMASRLKMWDFAKNWVERGALSEETQKNELSKLRGDSTNEAVLVLIYQHGEVPLKVIDPSFYSVPKLRSRTSGLHHAQVSWLRRTGLEGGAEEIPVGVTRVLHDIEESALRDFQDKRDGLLAKKVVGRFAKEAAGYAVREVTDSPLLGALATIGLLLSDQADLRSWRFLPRDLQFLRVYLPSGEQELRVKLRDGSQATFRVNLKPGNLTFLSLRDF